MVVLKDDVMVGTSVEMTADAMAIGKALTWDDKMVAMMD